MGARDLSTQIDEALDEELRSGKANLYDTHPALPERIAALEQLALGEGTEDRVGERERDEEGGKAIELLEGVPALERALLRFMLADTAGIDAIRSVPWEMAIAETYPKIWRAQTDRNAELLELLAPGTIPQDQPGLADLTRKALGNDAQGVPAEHLAAHAANAIGTALACKLNDAGWRIETSPGAPILLRKDGMSLDPWKSVLEIAAGKDSFPAWKRECLEAGLAEKEALNSPPG